MPPRPDNWLRRARLELGLTQSELARRTGIPQPQISRYEYGQWPSRETLLRLAAALKINIEDKIRGP